MVSSACGPPHGVARMIGWVGPPITAVSGTPAGVAGGGCQAGISVVDSCASEPIPAGMVAAMSWTGSAAAGVPGLEVVAAAGASQGGGAAGGSVTGCEPGPEGAADPAAAAARAAAPAASSADVAELGGAGATGGGAHAAAGGAS